MAVDQETRRRGSGGIRHRRVRRVGAQQTQSGRDCRGRRLGRVAKPSTRGTREAEGGGADRCRWETGKKEGRGERQKKKQKQVRTAKDAQGAEEVRGKTPAVP